MIFVTVGTHEQPFNRLIQKVDELKRDGVIKDDVIIQTGFSTYEPKYCQWSKLIPYQQMVKNVADGVYAEIRTLNSLRVFAQEEAIRLKNRIARWFSIYFPNYKDVYGNVNAISGLMVLKKAPLPEDIVKLGVEGVNHIWRESKVRSVGLKKAKELVTAASHSVGVQNSQDTLKTSFVVGAEHLSGSDVRLRSQTSDWTLHYGGRD